MDGVRLDKWLWAARFFKTRSQAKAAIQSGHVRVAGSRVKAAKDVRLGDALTIRRGADEFAVQVAALSERRGDATAAAHLYVETPASVARREAAAAERRALRSSGAMHDGRPTKKARRQMQALPGRDRA